MTAAEVNIDIEQGATFLLGMVLHDPVYDDDGNLVLDDDGNPTPGDPRDLTGCWMRMQIRPRAKSQTLWVDATSKTIEEDPEGGERIFLGPGGQVDIVLTDLDTMKVVRTSGAYDLELVHPAGSGVLRPYVERVLQGAVSCTLNVTRDVEDDQ